MINQEQGGIMGDLLIEVEPNFNKMKSIISYLIAYGNTREDDLISFGIKTLQLSMSEVKDLIDKMATYALIEKVVHNRLEPKVIYIKKGSMIPISMELQAICGTADLINLDDKDVEGAKLILDQAALVSTKKPD